MLDSSIPLMAKGIDGLKMLEDGSQIAQLWQNQKTDSELNRLYKETNGDLNKMMEIGKTSPMARFVMPQLQARQAAQQKVALDQQKTLSDIDKTQSEIGKIKSETGKIGAETSETNQKIASAKLLQAKQAVFAGAASGNPEIIKNGLDAARAAGALDEQIYTQFIQQLDSLGKNPVKISEWAKGVVLAGSQNPASFLFQTKDNEANNAQSDKNSQRTAETSRYSTDVNAQTAANKLSVEQAKIELEQKKGTVQQFGDNMYMVYPDGSAVPINSPTGQPVVKSTTTAAQQSAKNEENTRIQRVETIIPEIRTLLSKATGSYLGAGADLLANTVGISTEGAKATAQLKTLSGQMVAAMPKMSGPQSDKDVAMYKDMAGNLSDPTIPIETRLAALETIEKLNEKYKVINSGGIPATLAKPSSGGKPNAIDFFK